MSVPELTVVGAAGPARGARPAGQPAIEPLANDLATASAGLRRVVRTGIRGRATGPALPAAEVELLVTIIDAPGIGVGEAARALHLAGNTVSTLVSRLVEKGLITRRTDPDDGRVVRLSSTSTGRSRVRRWRQHRTDLFVDALTELDPADREALRRAVPALRRLTVAMQPASGDDAAS